MTTSRSALTHVPRYAILTGPRTTEEVQVVYERPGIEDRVAIVALTGGGSGGGGGSTPSP